jgi:hypothetical protein
MRQQLMEYKRKGVGQWMDERTKERACMVKVVFVLQILTKSITGKREKA